MSLNTADLSSIVLLVPVQALTPTQSNLLAFIRSQVAVNGRPPTHDEMAIHFGWKSSFTVRQHLALIEKKGALVRERGKARGIRSLQQSRENGIPLLGTIPAGPLSEAIESADEILAVPPGMFAGKHLFALRVNGDSMKCAGIHDGDIAVINPQPEVRDGEIAAILQQDDSTLKRVYRTSSGLFLKAENPDSRDIPIPAAEAENCRIAGRLVGIIRQKI
ncbi:transcriptional repressor LexA [Luteolibacter sp. Populi]|uniref:transcriptional repressor LexA n=1 Tax=Luteolibacter sp. Populi TaxID=3230487 RepID=UPI0034653226